MSSTPTFQAPALPGAFSSSHFSRWSDVVGTMENQTDIDEVLEKVQLRQELRNVRAAVLQMAIAAGAFIAYDEETTYFTYYDHEKQRRTRSPATVLLHLVPMVGEVEEC